MSKTYKLSELAEDDLADIWTFIAFESRNPDIATNFIDRIEAECAKLYRFPKKGESRDYLVKKFRKWTFGNYVIYYTIKKDHIRVERVLGSRQDQEGHLKR